MARRGWKSTLLIAFLVLDFIHFASWRKIINHHVATGTLESHPSVQDLQHSLLGKPRRRLQILDTRMGFPRPSRNVVIDSMSPRKELQGKYSNTLLFIPCVYHASCENYRD